MCVCVEGRGGRLKALLRPANFTLGPEEVLITYNVKSNSDLDGNSGGGGRRGQGSVCSLANHTAAN